MLYLIRRSYGYIYYLMVSSEPVSEALQPVYNQLQTLKRCLIEVKNSGGVSSPRELYPYSMKAGLASCSIINLLTVASSTRLIIWEWMGSSWLEMTSLTGRVVWTNFFLTALNSTMNCGSLLSQKEMNRQILSWLNTGVEEAVGVHVPRVRLTRAMQLIVWLRSLGYLELMKSPNYDVVLFSEIIMDCGKRSWTVNLLANELIYFSTRDWRAKSAPLRC